MHRPHRWWLAALVPVAIASLLLLTAQADGSQESHHPRSVVTPRHAPLLVTLPTTVMPLDAPQELLTEYVNAVTTANVATYVHAVEMANVAVYVDAVQQSAIEAAKEAAAHTADRPAAMVQNQVANQTGGTGSCTGFSIPDYIIQRESGGNPNAVNPSSGAYGCSQTLPGHYQSGGQCAGLDMYSVDGQRQCTYILSNGGSNLAPWALTR